MSYKLNKPYEEEQRMDFIVEYNHNQGLNIEETEEALYALEPWEAIEDGEVVDHKEEWEAEQAKKEEERINNLTMTSLDIIELIHSQGVEYTDIMAFLQANPMLNLQLTYCQNCYCGVVRQLCPLTIGDLTLTDELVVYAFRKKNGEDVQPPAPPVDDTDHIEDDLGKVEENLEL